MLKLLTRLKFQCFLCAFLLFSVNDAHAQNSESQSPIDIIVMAAENDIEQDNVATTHPPIRLTPDKSELIRLDEKAGSVIIGNPNHVSVLAESGETLVLVPKQAGATYVTVLNLEQQVIMSRHIIVASPQKKYVRIRKSCAGGGDNCQPLSVYYCPDMCHEIVMGGEQNAPMDNNAAAMAAGVENTANIANATQGIDPGTNDQ